MAYFILNTIFCLIALLVSEWNVYEAKQWIKLAKKEKEHTLEQMVLSEQAYEQRKKYRRYILLFTFLLLICTLLIDLYYQHGK